MNKVEDILETIQMVLAGTKWEKKVYLVGGAVRDMLLRDIHNFSKYTIKDLDFVVEGDPEDGIEVAKYIAKKLNVYSENNPLIFEKFYTAKLRLPASDGSVVELEFVAPRKEKYNPDSRKPEVQPSSLEDEILRRDFTINSLLMRLSDREIVDLTGHSMEDLQKLMLRTNRTPDIIFAEDPVRMLRAIRFTVKYNLQIPKDILKSIRKNVKEIHKVSKERIREELEKIFMLEKPGKAIRMLKITKLLDELLPELKQLVNLKQSSLYHKEDAFRHTLSVVDSSKQDLIVRLAALFHDIGKAATRTETNGKIQFLNHAKVGAEIAENILRRFKYSNDIIKKVKKMIMHHMDLKSAGPRLENLKDKTLRKFIYRVSDALEDTLELIHADNISHSEVSSMPEQITLLRERIKNMNLEEILNAKSLLRGDEILALGAPKELVKEIKERILWKVIENPSYTKEQAIEQAKSIIRTYGKKLLSQSQNKENKS